MKFGEIRRKSMKIIFNDPTKVNYEDASSADSARFYLSFFFFFSRTTIQKFKKVHLCFVFF